MISIVQISNLKVKASAMGLVLTISMLVTLISSLFILRSGLDTNRYYMLQTTDRLINNAESGIELLLAEESIIKTNESKTIDLFDEGNDSVFLSRKTWGAFEIITSQAIAGKKTISKSAMIASTFRDSTPLSVFVCDLGKPISVCGKTKLNGKCYVPESGFKRAYIEGQNYSGDKYVYGQQLKSKRELPALQKEFLLNIEQQLKNTVHENDSVVNVSGIKLPDTILNSFNKRTLVLESNGNMVIDQILIKGNVKIIAPNVLIKANAILESVLIMADKLTIEDNFIGAMQVLARETVNIGKKVILNYPSVIGLVSKQGIQIQNEKDPKIHIGEDSNITGDVFCIETNINFEFEPYVHLDKNSLITGNVYVNGKLDIKGKIHGSTYCKRFYLKTNSGIYENHLLNAEFDVGKLPKQYIGAFRIETNGEKEVLLWL